MIAVIIGVLIVCYGTWLTIKGVDVVTDNNVSQLTTKAYILFGYLATWIGSLLTGLGLGAMIE